MRNNSISYKYVKLMKFYKYYYHSYQVTFVANLLQFISQVCYFYLKSYAELLSKKMTFSFYVM